MDSRDLKIPGYMLYCVLVSALGSFAIGWVIGSVNLPAQITYNCENGNAHIHGETFPDCLPMSTSLWGFAVSSFSVGGLIGGVTGSCIQKKLGRKRTITFNTTGWLVGAIIIGCSVHPAMFIIGRILCGISCGLGMLCIPTYISEVSTIKARAAMSTCHELFLASGILVASVIGLPTSVVPYWRLNYALVGVPALVQFILMSTCVESPRWLVSVNRIDEAQRALQKLRGSHIRIEMELYDIVESQIGTAAATSILRFPDEKSAGFKESAMAMDFNPGEEDNLRTLDTGDETVAPRDDENLKAHAEWTGIFTDPVIRRITVILFALHFVQQWCGMNAIMLYSTVIFSAAFDVRMSMYMAIAAVGVYFVTTMISVMTIDRLGRRTLLLMAEVGCCIFSVLLVIGIRFQLPALLVVSVLMFVFSFAIGLGPVPWLITLEMTPPHATSLVIAVTTCVSWTMSFVVAQIFPILFDAIAGYSFCIFAGVSFLGIIYTLAVVPETKDRPVEHITRVFERHK